MKKCGFTLVELLVVIILLAIIALIATPIMLNVIDDSKESANKRSIEGYVRAINEAYYNEQVLGKKPEINEEFLSNVNTGGSKITCDGIIYNADYSTILYNCNVGESNIKYCYLNGKHYDCEDKEFIKLYLESGGKISLITTLLYNYDDSATTGLIHDEENADFYYFKGDKNINNYLWYGGFLYRIISFDRSNNTIKLISQMPLTIIQPASEVWNTEEEYKNSYINKWLNGVFYSSLDDKVKNNIVNSTFNVGIYTDVDEVTTTGKVGLLDYDQYIKAGGTDSYLDIKDNFWLANRYNNNYNSSIYINGVLSNGSMAHSFGVRPVININDMIIYSGNGTISDSYKSDYKSTSTSNVQVGEYVNVPYNGSDGSCGTDNKCTFRVVSKDSDSIKVTLNGLLANSSYGNSTININNTVYNLLNSFASKISNDYRYTNNKTFYIGDYPSLTDFENIKDETLEASLGLPTVGEIFTGNDIDMSRSSEKIFVNVDTIENPTLTIYYWTMNRFNGILIRNVADNGSFSDNHQNSGYGVRPVIFLKNNLNFVSGDGTAQNPYELE